jgi:competence protein ComEA
MRLFNSAGKNKKQMFANQVRGTIIMCVCLAMVPLFLFLDSLLPEKDVPVLATHFQDSLVVEICDAGDSSGIYYLRPGTTAGQLFRDIGSRFPLKEDFTIKNGASLLPTSEGEVIIGQMKAAKRLALGLPLDVNLASEEDLMMIPGIGPKMSAAIAVYRKENRWIKSIDQLREIRGIGEKKLSRLKGYLYVDEQSP